MNFLIFLLALASFLFIYVTLGTLVAAFMRRCLSKCPVRALRVENSEDAAIVTWLWPLMPVILFCIFCACAKPAAILAWKKVVGLDTENTTVD